MPRSFLINKKSKKVKRKRETLSAEQMAIHNDDSDESCINPKSSTLQNHLTEVTNSTHNDVTSMAVPPISALPPPYLFHGSYMHLYNPLAGYLTHYNASPLLETPYHFTSNYIEVNGRYENDNSTQSKGVNQMDGKANMADDKDGIECKNIDSSSETQYTSVDNSFNNCENYSKLKRNVNDVMDLSENNKWTQSPKYDQVKASQQMDMNPDSVNNTNVKISELKESTHVISEHFVTQSSDSCSSKLVDTSADDSGYRSPSPVSDPDSMDNLLDRESNEHTQHHMRKILIDNKDVNHKRLKLSHIDEIKDENDVKQKDEGFNEDRFESVELSMNNNMEVHMDYHRSAKVFGRSQGQGHFMTQNNESINNQDFKLKNANEINMGNRSLYTNKPQIIQNKDDPKKWTKGHIENILGTSSPQNVHPKVSQNLRVQDPQFWMNNLPNLTKAIYPDVKFPSYSSLVTSPVDTRPYPNSPDPSILRDNTYSKPLNPINHLMNSHNADSGYKHESNVAFPCTDCKKSFSTNNGLSKHRQYHCSTKTKKEFSCKHCGKTYTSLGALKMHIRTHTLPCKCHLCGKAFSRPWLLQGHIRTHTGEKPFSCQHCSRSFADRSNLRAHLQTHSDIKKYCCKNCSKTFSRMSLLLKHEDGGCSS